MVPTGKISTIPKDSVNDFWSAPHQLGFASGDPEFATNCGTASGCAGYNNLLIIDQSAESRTQEPAVTLSSPWSGIQVEYFTELPGVVVYSCYWMNGAIPIKSTQGKNGSNPAATDGFVNSGGCVALEAQEWSDGINNPQWGRDKYQIIGPGETLEWDTTYQFGVIDI